MANTTGDPIRDIFLAGIGALAIGAEKTKSAVEQLVQGGHVTNDQGQDIINELVRKGQITVEQGKEMANNLSEKAKTQTLEMRDDIIAAHMKTMSKKERDAFAARVAEIAASTDEDEQLKKEEDEEVAVAAAEEAARQA